MGEMIQSVPESARIDPTRLRRSACTLSLVEEAARVGILTPEGYQRLQSELFSLLEKQIELYTGGESTSVANATAAKLLGSILYNTDLALLRRSPDASARLLAEKKFEDIYYEGLLINRELNLKARSLLRKVKSSRLKIVCRAYNLLLNKTLDELILGYDDKFDAAAQLAAVDYPTPTLKRGKRGISGMIALLTELERENRFVASFPESELETMERRCGYKLLDRGVSVNVGQLLWSHAMLSLLATGEPTVPFDIDNASALPLRCPNREEAYYALCEVVHKLSGRSDEVYLERLAERSLRTLSAIFDGGEAAIRRFARG